MTLLALLFASGCGQEDVSVYRVPKEKLPPSAEARMPDGRADPDSANVEPGLKWLLPAGWKEVPPGEMRVASFKVVGKDGKQADVSVVPLPGSAGGDLSNVNRWRGQVGQPPVSAEELKKLAQPVEMAGQPAELYDQGGEDSSGEPTRILAAIQRRDGTTWFFKMTGDNQLVAESKPAFVQFLKSVQFTAAETAAKTPPMPAEAAAPVASQSEGRPQWTAPSGWKEAPGGQFLVAKFVITGDGSAQAAVNISSSAGDGGGLSANVNRWRKQLGLGELSPDEIAKSAKSIDVSSGTATMVEMSGRDARSGQPASLVGAIVLQPGQAWFYKLMGDAKVVGAQKEAFIRFVQEAKY